MRKPLGSLLAIAVFIAPVTAFTQQEVMVSQYMFNGLFLNPAYAGTHPYVSGSLLHRAQWVHVDGAPRTSMFAVDGPLMNNKMGVGLSIVHDQIGVSRDLEIDGHYSYHLRLGASKLCLGLKAGLSLYSAKLDQLRYWDENDPAFAQNISNELVGKFGFGVYWYDALSYVGLSVPMLYAADQAVSPEVQTATGHYFTQHYYLTAGRVFHLNEYFDLKPSIMVKYQPEAPFEVDLNTHVLYKERFWFGVGYRTGDAIVGMIEYKITPYLRAGYAYDMTISELRGYSQGSHEVMLGVDLGQDVIKIKTPRYF